MPAGLLGIRSRGRGPKRVDGPTFAGFDKSERGSRLPSNAFQHPASPPSGTAATDDALCRKIRGTALSVQRRLVKMTAALAPPQRTELTPSVKFGALEYGFWIFLLIAIGRIGELIPGLSSFPLGKISLALPLVIRLAQHRRLPGLTTSTRPLARTAKWLAVLAVLLTSISIWPGASVNFLIQQLTVLIAVVSIAYVMCRAWRSLRATLLALVLSGAILARAALSTYTGGRAETATMYDTNDLAYLLVTVLPLAIGFVICSRTNAKRILYGGIVATLLVAVLLTQSRGGLLGLVAIVLFMTFAPIRAPTKPAGKAPIKRKGKIWLMVGVFGFGLLVWSYLPKDARERFSTVLDLTHDYNLDPTDKTGRGQIWTRGLRAAKARPIGYGPETFDMVDMNYGGKFSAPHNSLLEALVELGVLGFILFVTAYVRAWRGLQGARRNLLAGESLSIDQEEQVVFARLLQVSLVGNAVAGFFLSMAYATVLWTILALSMAVMAMAEQAAAGKPKQGPSLYRREIPP